MTRFILLMLALLAVQPARAQQVELGAMGGNQVALKGLNNFPKWSRLIEPLLTAAGTGGETAQWTSWSASLRRLPAAERLFAINSRGNERIKYRADPQNWSQSDYWELPGEVFDKERTTDCEGYAILKYYLALKAGFPADDLFLLAGAVRSTREAHVVLLVRAGGTVYVLDNRRPTVQQVDLFDDFVPLYVLDSRQAWLVRAPAAR